MSSTAYTPSAGMLYPLHAMMLGSIFPMFLGALLSDLAYWSSYQVQWINFAQWLIVGGLVGGGLTLLAAAISLIRTRGAVRAEYIYPVTLVTMWMAAFANILVHSKDAWATMPWGLYLSFVVVILAGIATWIGFSARSAGEAK